MSLSPYIRKKPEFIPPEPWFIRPSGYLQPLRKLRPSQPFYDFVGEPPEPETASIDELIGNSGLISVPTLTLLPSLEAVGIAPKAFVIDSVRTKRLLDFEIPAMLANIADSIERSKRILDLPDNWDEEGSAPYEHSTWERAGRFLLQTAIALWNACGIALAAPSITHGPEGSIDILWKTSEFTLLVNVPEDLEQAIDYYGCQQGGVEIKGKLDPTASNKWLLMWMTD